MIDLRSDTVTRPSAGMRAAMAEAEVGDDVYGEDPTVLQLEAAVADALGMECGLFVPSGTQANLIAILCACARGDEYIAGQEAHNYRFEGGGAAVLGSVQPQPLPFDVDGSLDLDQVRAAVKPDDPHFARTRLVCLENTQGGKAVAPAYFARMRTLASELGLAVHLDGARLFNACVAHNVVASEYARHCDTVSVCLSKGLGAPVGSVLCLAAGRRKEAVRLRKMLGGGMRQAGVIAAAGLYALAHNRERLNRDHHHAALVQAALAERWPDRTQAQTSMVFLDIGDAHYARLRSYLAEHQVRVGRPRWVFHLDVSERDVARLIELIERYPD